MFGGNYSRFRGRWIMSRGNRWICSGWSGIVLNGDFVLSTFNGVDRGGFVQ